MEPVYGIHLGLVISDNADPEGRNRVQVWIPYLSTTLYKSINSKLKNLNIKSPSDLDSVDPTIMETLRLILPWAEYGAPLFGGSSGNYSSATGITSTTNTSPFPNSPPLYPPSLESSSESLRYDGNKLPADSSTGIITVDDDKILPSTNPVYTKDNSLGIVVNNPNLIGKKFNLTNSDGSPFLAVSDIYSTDGKGTLLVSKGQPVVLVGFDTNDSHGVGSNYNSSITEISPLAASAVGLTYIPGGGINKNGGSLGGIVKGSASFIVNPSSDANAIIAQNNSDSLKESGIRPVPRLCRSAAYAKESNIATAGSAVGTFTTPNAGSKVWVFFMGGDIQRPVYFAQAVNTGDVKAFTG
jgi:hypothetical protein